MIGQTARPPQPVFTIHPPWVLSFLGAVIVVLVLLSGVVTQSDNHWIANNVRPFLNVDAEANIPTTFSGAQLMLASILLFVVGVVKQAGLDRFSKHWLLLGCVLSILAVDELAGIHEQFNTVGILLQRLGWTSVYTGALRWPWVISGCVAVVLLVATFQRFVRSLPRRTMVLFVLSGTLFFGGAIGFEMIGGFIVGLVEAGEEVFVRPWLMYHVEESLEMIGVALFIYSILDYARPIVFTADGERRSVTVSLGCQ